MARLRQPLTEDDIKKIPVGAIRKEYLTLAYDYNRILNGEIYYCHKCNEFHLKDAFYKDNRYASGLFPQCKKTLLEEATDYDRKTGEYKDNREKTIEVFKKLNLPFIDDVYNQAVTSTEMELGEKNRSTAFQHCLTIIKSLPQYKNLTFAESDYASEDVESSGKQARKEIKKKFGLGYSESDYLYLQEQYDDWRARTEIDSKAADMYVMQICLQNMDIDKDRKSGKDVTNKLKALDILMNSAKLQPKQNVSGGVTDTLSFSQMIDQWEEHNPIPEPAEEFKDVDGIGKYIRVWFTGWLSKALGLKANVFTKEFDEEINKYVVNKPDMNEEGSANEIYEQLFGMEGGVS
jgi:hypothetical protein